MIKIYKNLKDGYRAVVVKVWGVLFCPNYDVVGGHGCDLLLEVHKINIGLLRKRL